MNFFSSSSYNSNASRSKLASSKLSTLKKIQNATTREVEKINEKIPKLYQDIQSVELSYAPDYHGEVLHPSALEEKNAKLTNIRAKIRKMSAKKQQLESRLPIINDSIEKKESEKKKMQNILSSKLTKKLRHNLGTDNANNIFSYMGETELSDDYPYNSKTEKCKKNKNCIISGGNKTRKNKKRLKK